MTSLGLGAGVLFRTNEKKITGARRRRLLIRSLTFLVRNNLYWGRTSRPRIHPVGFLLFLLLYQSALSIPLHPCQQNIYLQSELSQHILKGKKKHIQTWLQSHQNDCVFILDINGLDKNSRSKFTCNHL